MYSVHHVKNSPFTILCTSFLVEVNTHIMWYTEERVFVCTYGRYSVR